MSNPPVLQVLRPLQKAFHVGHHWRGLTRQFSGSCAALCTYLVRTGVRGRGRARVRCSTSALTEATTAGPVWRSTVGTATRGVLPPPVGARACTSTLRRGGLATSRPASVPSCDRPGTGPSTSRSARSAGRAQAHLRVGADAEPGATAPYGRAATGCRVHAHTGRPETGTRRDQSVLDLRTQGGRCLSPR